MRENFPAFFVIAVGAILIELGGLWLIIRSDRLPNPARMKRYGGIACLMGIVAFLLGFISLYM